jgi:integrase
MNTLRESVQDYLAMRHSLGFKLQKAGVGLYDFAAFMEQQHASSITTSLALKWAQKATLQPAEWASRLSYVRGFARYRSAIDPRTQVPPNGLLPYRPRRAHPYIYTSDEVRRLLQAALNLSSAAVLRPWTYYVLLGLLSVSGLRISEALNLKVADTDLDEGVLAIHDAKFGKSRLVPLHWSTRQVVSDYLTRRDRFLAGRNASYLFITGRGNRLDGGDVHRTFYTLSRQIGLRGPTASHGPRLHDFRHRFAVETLLQWYRSGEDVERRLPILSTYLGHVHPSDTYWYLSLCPELMGLAVKLLEHYWGDDS